MGETSDQIEREIREKRSELSYNFNELEQKVKNAMDWRAQFEERPGTLIALAFGGGVVLSSLLPTRHSRRRSRDTDRRVREYHGYGGQQTPAATEGRKPANFINPSSTQTSARHNGRSGEARNNEARNNLDAIVGALLSLAVTSVAGLVDKVLPGFQHEFTKAKSARNS